MSWTNNVYGIKEWSANALYNAPLLRVIGCLWNATYERNFVVNSTALPLGPPAYPELGGGDANTENYLKPHLAGLGFVDDFFPFPDNDTDLIGLMLKMDSLVIGEWCLSGSQTPFADYQFIDSLYNKRFTTKPDNLTAADVLNYIGQSSFVRFTGAPPLSGINKLGVNMTPITVEWALQMYKILDLFRAVKINTSGGTVIRKFAIGEDWSEVSSNWPGTWTPNVGFASEDSMIADYIEDEEENGSGLVRREYSTKNFSPPTGAYSSDMQFFSYTTTNPAGRNPATFVTEGQDWAVDKYSKIGEIATQPSFDLRDFGISQSVPTFPGTNNAEGWLMDGNFVILRYDVPTSNAGGFEFVTK